MQVFVSKTHFIFGMFLRSLAAIPIQIDSDTVVAF